MANSVSMLVTHHSGEDGDEDDDEDCSCHCFCPFQRTVVVVCVSHECIIPSVSSIVKANQEPIWNYSRLDFTPSLPLEAVVNPHDNHCHC